LITSRSARRARRAAGVLAAVAMTAGLAAACDSASAGSVKGTITLYSGQHEQTTQSLVDAFEKQTGIKVNVRYNDEDSFADEIVAEKAHPVADVFYTENTPALQYLQNRGLLASVDSSTLARTASRSASRPGSAC
jgi:iron(III) transport system substrate-binding protein